MAKKKTPSTRKPAIPVAKCMCPACEQHSSLIIKLSGNGTLYAECIQKGCRVRILGHDGTIRIMRNSDLKGLLELDTNIIPRSLFLEHVRAVTT